MGRRSRPHLPAWPFARYKDTLVPRRFSNTSLRPFPPFLHGPAQASRRASGHGKLHFLPAGPWSRQNRYDAASGKNAAARPPALIRSTPRQHCLVNHPTVRRPLSEPLVMTLMKHPAF
jgi:hypothetical protein